MAYRHACVHRIYLPGPANTAAYGNHAAEFLLGFSDEKRKPSTLLVTSNVIRLSPVSHPRRWNDELQHPRMCCVEINPLLGDHFGTFLLGLSSPVEQLFRSLHCAFSY
jgi:hypothetical protein